MRLKPYRALLLFSSGLDSLLTAYILKEEKLHLIALSLWHVFLNDYYPIFKKKIKLMLKGLTEDIHFLDMSSVIIKKVQNPLYGYGKNLNPCIDCKIEMYKLAKKYMQKFKADFIATGEVIGQRPKSQHKDTVLFIEKKAGLSRMVLRPLSAKLLPLTIPEEKKLLRRDCLYNISGRGRNQQYELVKKYKISQIPTPGGGCLLTISSFTARLEDLMKYSPNLTKEGVFLLRVGRHFRISPSFKLIVARNGDEEDILLKIAGKDNNLYKLYNINNYPPFGLGIGQGTVKDKHIAAKILAYYVKRENYPKKIVIENNSEKKSFSIRASISQEIINQMIIK